MYGQHPQGILDVLREELGEPVQGRGNALALYIASLYHKLQTTAQLTQEERTQGQEVQKHRYDETVHPHSFTAGQQVLLLLLSSANKLLVSWEGPFVVIEKVWVVDYCVRVPVRGVSYDTSIF